MPSLFIRYRLIGRKFDETTGADIRDRQTSNMYDINPRAGAYEMTTPPAEFELNGRRYRAIAEHLFSNLNDEGVILSLKNGKYYGLNSVGVSIWTSIQEAATLAELEAAVMEEYDVDEETCRREVSQFLEQMLAEELIEAVDEPGA